MAYYLFHHVWDVPDRLIVETMNTHLQREGGERTFQEEWLKVAIQRDLGGRDLVRNGGAEDRHNHTYRFAPISPVEAYCLYCALSQIFHNSEKPIPDLLKEVYDEPNPDTAEALLEKLLSKRKGNPKGGDITIRRLQLMKRKSSFLEGIQKVFEGISDQIDLGVEDSKEAMLGLSFYLQRVIEKEVELYLLTSMEKQADFDWFSYINERHEKTDAERAEAYPNLIKEIIFSIMNDDKGTSLRLLDKIST